MKIKREIEKNYKYYWGIRKCGCIIIFECLILCWRINFESKISFRYIFICLILYWTKI